MILKICSFLLPSLLVASSAFANVSAYFNHNSRSSYTDPYRRISRPGDNLEEVVLAEIRQARRTIYLAVQELRLPLIAAALIEKKRQGVDVRIILENDYNFDILSQRDSGEGEYEASKLLELRALIDANRDGRFQKEELESLDAIYMLRAAQVPIMDDTSDNSQGSGLMHHKFLVIDGKTTIVSTANFTMSCIHGDVLVSDSRGNANSMVVVESANFARFFTEEFAQLWGNGRRGNFGQNKTYRGPMTTTVRGARLTVQFSPTSRRYNWEETVNGLAALYLFKARSSIRAALFVFSDQIIANVMQQRHEAGVQVGVLIEPKFGYRDYSELLDLMGMAMLNQRCKYEPGNNPWPRPATDVGLARLPRGDVLHHKFAVVDNRTVIMGSQNWSDAANFTNDENLIVIEDSAVAEQFSQEYARLRRSAVIGPIPWLKDQIRKQEEACPKVGRN